MKHKTKRSTPIKRSGEMLLITAVIGRAVSDLRRRSVNFDGDRISAAYYLGSRQFDEHCDMVGFDADGIRNELVSKYIPECELKTDRLRKLYIEYIGGGYLFDIAQRNRVNAMTLVNAWAMMDLYLPYPVERLRQQKIGGSKPKAVYSETTVRGSRAISARSPRPAGIPTEYKGRKGVIN